VLHRPQDALEVAPAQEALDLIGAQDKSRVNTQAQVVQGDVGAVPGVTVQANARPEAERVWGPNQGYPGDQQPRDPESQVQAGRGPCRHRQGQAREAGHPGRSQEGLLQEHRGTQLRCLQHPGTGRRGEGVGLWQDTPIRLQTHSRTREWGRRPQDSAAFPGGQAECQSAAQVPAGPERERAAPLPAAPHLREFAAEPAAPVPWAPEWTLAQRVERELGQQPEDQRPSLHAATPTELAPTELTPWGHPERQSAAVHHQGPREYVQHAQGH